MVLNAHFFRGFRGLNYAPTHYYVRYGVIYRKFDNAIMDRLAEYV
ncbi:hypothetical protein [Helicobacter winghamensis]